MTFSFIEQSDDAQVEILARTPVRSRISFFFTSKAIATSTVSKRVWGLNGANDFLDFMTRAKNLPRATQLQVLNEEVSFKTAEMLQKTLEVRFSLILGNFTKDEVQRIKDLNSQAADQLKSGSNLVFSKENRNLDYLSIILYEKLISIPELEYTVALEVDDTDPAYTNDGFNELFSLDGITALRDGLLTFTDTFTMTRRDVRDFLSSDCEVLRQYQELKDQPDNWRESDADSSEDFHYRLSALSKKFQIYVVIHRLSFRSAEMLQLPLEDRNQVIVSELERSGINFQAPISIPISMLKHDIIALLVFERICTPQQLGELSEASYRCIKAAPNFIAYVALRDGLIEAQKINRNDEGFFVNDGSPHKVLLTERGVIAIYKKLVTLDFCNHFWGVDDMVSLSHLLSKKGLYVLEKDPRILNYVLSWSESPDTVKKTIDSLFEKLKNENEKDSAPKYRK